MTHVLLTRARRLRCVNPEWGNLYSGVSGAIGIPVCVVVFVHSGAMIMHACAC